MNFNWKTKLILLSVNQFFYRAGVRSIIPILPLFIKDISEFNNNEIILWSGWILSSPFLISFFSTPFWGTIGDKIGRNYTTFLAAFGFVLSQISLSFSSSVTFILIAFSLQEIFGGAYPSAVSFTTVFSPKEKVADSLSFIQFSNALGNILGPLLGGLIADNFGFKYVFLLFAFSVFVTSIPILLFKEEENLSTVKRSSLKNNFMFFIKNNHLILIAILLLSYTLSVTMIRPIFTLYIDNNFLEVKNLATISGLLFTLFGFAAAISNLSLPFLKKYFSLKFILINSLIIAGLFFVIINFTKDIYLFATFLFIIGLALGFILPILYSLMSEQINQNFKAGVMGIGSSFQMVGNLIGPTLAGLIVAITNLNFSFIFCGIVLLISLLIFIYNGDNIEKNN
ncbi:MAG: MFS transporter [Melioribacteraceae bacterium]|nr:MFS transporter [Melioribacteraceae bacterium]